MSYEEKPYTQKYNTTDYRVSAGQARLSDEMKSIEYQFRNFDNVLAGGMRENKAKF